MEKRRSAVRQPAAGLIGALAAGEQFEVFFAICPKPGFKPGARIKVDATMPEHRHRMNYLPSVVPTTGGYRSEGWMFTCRGSGKSHSRWTASALPTA